MKIVKLSIEERVNMDAIGWFGLSMYCEREQSYNYFNASDIEMIENMYRNDTKLSLYRITFKGKEVGRFTVKEVKDSYCLSGLIIYSQYRNRGYFKMVLDYIIFSYPSIYLYTSNKYMTNVLFKDERFLSNGWEYKKYSDDIEIRFETNKIKD